MNRSVAVGLAAVAGMVGVGLVRKAQHADFAGRMSHRIEKVMARLPENSPPKLVMTVLPALREQNEQILGLLREQNELLRQLRERPQ